MTAEIIVDLPIKACHQCWQSFTLDEWGNLELVDAELEGLTEMRRCPCGEVLTLELAGLDQLALAVDAIAYQNEFPESARPTQALQSLQAMADKERGPRAFALVGLVLLVCLIVILAVIGTGHFVSGLLVESPHTSFFNCTDCEGTLNADGSRDLRWWMGGYALILDDVQPTPFIECRGSLGLWDVPDDVVGQLKKDV